MERVTRLELAMLAGSDVPALTAFFQELSCEEQLRISSFALECEVPEEEPEL